MTILDDAAVAAYLAYESAIMAKYGEDILGPLRRAWLTANAAAQAARGAVRQPRLNYLKAVAERSPA